MIVHSNATERLVQRDFTFDGLARLENRTLFRASETPVQPDAFAYNSRSELTNAIYQITQSGTNAIRQFSYDFDPIGNRNSATEFGTNTAYVASALNQYTSINPINPVNPVENFNPEFDLDGNQTLLKTTTGIWHVWYNAENRPVIFSNETTVVEMAYDYMGRRFEYKEIVSGTLTRHERYLYRGYLQITALDLRNNSSVKQTIAWDPFETVATRPLALQIGTTAYYYSFDQVKNVTELFDSSGALASTYDYSPFGHVTSFQITQSGNQALTQLSNPLTFSSEIHDSILGLQYYNYRHLNLLDGRWVNRDPIGERGGLALYEICDNDMLDYYDVLGAVRGGGGSTGGGGGSTGGGGGRTGGGGGRTGGGGGSEYIPNKPPTEPPKTPGGEPGKTFPLWEKITDTFFDYLTGIGLPEQDPLKRTLTDALILCNDKLKGVKKCSCCVVFCQIQPQDDGPPDYSCSLVEAFKKKSINDKCPSHSMMFAKDGSFVWVLSN